MDDEELHRVFENTFDATHAGLHFDAALTAALVRNGALRVDDVAKALKLEARFIANLPYDRRGLFRARLGALASALQAKLSEQGHELPPLPED